MARVEKATLGGEQKVTAAAVAAENEEATAAWSGVLFDRFVEFRDVIVDGLGGFSDVAMKTYPPQPGDRVLDIGCGFGDTTQQLAALVGAEGEAVGVDVAEPFIEASIREAKEASVDNVEFFAADVQVVDLRGPYDHVFSRMGVMFFANPVQALRNIRESLRPGGRFVACVWRRKADNPWLHRAEQVVEQYLEEPEEPEDVRCGPGPFSMANADTVSEQLEIAGFELPTFMRCDLPFRIGSDLDRAVAYNMAIGPAAELLRICPAEEVERLRPKLQQEIRETLSDYVQPDGKVVGTASTWIVSATVPN
jgi:SAM-dependent methyltransferase